MSYLKEKLITGFRELKTELPRSCRVIKTPTESRKRLDRVLVVKLLGQIFSERRYI